MAYLYNCNRFRIFTYIRRRPRRCSTPATGNHRQRRFIGRTVIVRKALDPEGTVFYEGEIWQAVMTKGYAGFGESVIIKKIRWFKALCFQKQ
jgi:membrane protein implicated in regulation of membrane protease activity